ncbi:MAG: malectin, partial [Armatimonadetes bacterium]|nr:malectin [Armatimonadota bacterium]
NGHYRVKLQFVEAAYGEVGKRVFGVKIQGKTVLENLDIFARAGQNTALDIPISDVRVTDGLMKIEFVPVVGAPLISAIVIEGTGDSAPFVRKINSAGGPYAGYEPERPKEAPLAQQNRALPSADFYLDFARANFGREVAGEASAILTKIDGMAMPLTSEWNPGPGGVIIQNVPWDQLKHRFAWVEEWAALRPQVRGEGNRARFDAWHDTFRAAAAMAQVGSCRGQLDAAMAALKTSQDAAKREELAAQALALRLELAQKWAAMMSLYVAAAQTPGEMGTIANLEQHSRRFLKFISTHDAALTAALGRSLPAEAQPSPRYAGEPRILVPTARSLVAPHESLALKVILIGPETGKWRDAALLWRPLQAGKKQGRFRRVPLAPIARGVYRAALPPQKEGTTFEYFIQADFAGRTMVYPASAPTLNRTVVVWRTGTDTREAQP